MNKTKIDWADYTWNPVTGCLHGCSYCYARKQSMRFSGDIRLNMADERCLREGELFILKESFCSEKRPVYQFPVWICADVA